MLCEFSRMNAHVRVEERECVIEFAANSTDVDSDDIVRKSTYLKLAVRACLSFG